MAAMLRAVLVCAFVVLAAGVDVATTATRSKVHARTHAHARAHAKRFLERIDESSFDISSFYHTSAQLEQEFKQLQATCPQMTLTYATEGSARLPVVRLAALGGRAEHRVLFFFGEHAREIISPESALNFVKHMCGGAAETASRARALRHNVEFMIFPNINPRGRARVEAGQYCVRANEHGVDLNRNWADHWEDDNNNEDAKRKQAFGGRSPFSEAETRLLKLWSTNFQPTIFITVHSGCLGMYMPYAYSGGLPSNKVDDDTMLSIIKAANRQYCNCDAGAAGKEVGYLCPGTCLDYVYDKLNTRLSFAFEIYDGQKGFRNDDSLFSLLETKAARRRAHHKHNHALHSHTEVDAAEETEAHHSCFVQDEPPAPAHHEAEGADEDLEDFVEVDESHAWPVPSSERESNCLRMFNPVTKQMYDGTVENWSLAYLFVIEQSVATKIA